jgi:hypothetical protein
MADGNDLPNFGEMIFDQTRAAIIKDTEGMTLPEAAAHYDASLVFHDIGDGARSKVGMSEDKKPIIIINPNLRSADQSKELYSALTLIALNNQFT